MGKIRCLGDGELMKYFSVCSGIEAASVAWEPLGWRPAGFSEIEPFPCAVLSHRFPDVKNYGDMTKCHEWEIGNGTAELLVGGTPCQSFSIAGKREGMDDPRGQLAIKFFDIVRKLRPRWIVWENVLGILSSNQGRDFGAFLSEMGKCGYGFAYRILDAQYFGVPQRRRRVFVVGYLGDWRGAAAVLFEPESLCRNPKKSGGKGRGNASGSEDGSEAKCGQCGVIWEPDGAMESCPVCGGIQIYTPRIRQTLQTTANDYSRADGFCMLTRYSSTPAWIKCQCCEDYWCSIHKKHIADCECPPIEEWKSDPYGMQLDGPKSFKAADARRTGSVKLKDQVPTLTSQTNSGDTAPCVLDFPTVAIRTANTGANGHGISDEKSHTLDGSNGQEVVFGKIAMGTDLFNGSLTGDKAVTVSSRTGIPDATGPRLIQSMRVRRLTPLECERLQGFSDGWTDIPYKGKTAPDGPRYKAIGNSMAVPVMRWIGQRIAKFMEIFP